MRRALARECALRVNDEHRRIREITHRLEHLYGEAVPPPPWDPVDELVACMLSQHTSDANSHRAFALLKARYPTWEAVLEAPPEQLADTIRCGGLANVKAARIQEVLRLVDEREGRVDLSCLTGMTDEEGRRYLTGLPGVGPKTAAIVLCFGLGRPVLPVDTHVFRVAWRLGLVDRRAGEARAHDLLQAQVPSELVYRFHVALIRHGRQTCKAPAPRCEECVLSDLCRYFREARAKAAAE